MKILLVEDEPQLVKDIANYLSQEGYICELVTTAKDAEEKVTLFDYDCILLDITLPDGNGLKILEQL
ncbi:MAG: response regulator, partial [Cyclobacteriaceae bacterium]|nr:response regulator [Cyclobacteriaceae bacterium]